MSSSPPEGDSPTIAAVRGLLRQKFRVSTSDSRVFLGEFMGTDQLLNLLLVNTEEYLLASPSGRYVGQVMIPWKTIKQVEASRVTKRNRVEEDADMYL